MEAFALSAETSLCAPGSCSWNEVTVLHHHCPKNVAIAVDPVVLVLAMYSSPGFASVAHECTSGLWRSAMGPCNLSIPERCACEASCKASTSMEGEIVDSSQ